MHNTISIVRIDGKIVKVYSHLKDAEAFCEWAAEFIKVKSEFSIEICVLPVEDCFNRQWSMLQSNNFMPQGKYHITDYQQWYSDQERQMP